MSEEKSNPKGVDAPSTDIDCTPGGLGSYVPDPPKQPTDIKPQPNLDPMSEAVHRFFRYLGKRVFWSAAPPFALSLSQKKNNRYHLLEDPQKNVDNAEDKGHR